MTQAIDIAMSDLEEGVFEEGALHGCALDLIQQIINLPGEYYTDEQCLKMIHYAANAWSKLADQGLS
jgi:hypothetical protein